VSYCIGFGTAAVLTLIAYALVTNHWLAGGALITAIMGLAAVQLMVQLVFFLHFGRGGRSRLDLAALFFMLLILVIIVGGSLWIMDNLNYNMQMTPEQMDTYMQSEGNKGF
jgi:cytochrome o ubiquinol oxidase operon protein cyoD